MATQLTWWAFFAIPLALLLVLLVARPAAALSLNLGPISSPAISSPEDEEETEEDESEAEEEELEAEEDEEENGQPPAECLLRTARAQAFVYPSQGKVRLLIHYTAMEPTDAGVAYRLSGSKGSLKFPSADAHLAHSGSIHLSESLGHGAIAKAAAAKSFTVELRIPATPHSCHRFDIRHLTVEHGGANRPTWLQAESIYGA